MRLYRSRSRYAATSRPRWPTGWSRSWSARVNAPEPLERAETQVSAPSPHGRISEIATYHRLAYREAWPGWTFSSTVKERAR